MNQYDLFHDFHSTGLFSEQLLQMEGSLDLNCMCPCTLSPVSASEGFVAYNRSTADF